MLLLLLLLLLLMMMMTMTMTTTLNSRYWCVVIANVECLDVCFMCLVHSLDFIACSSQFRVQRTNETSSSAVAEKPRCRLGQFWVGGE